MYVFTLNREFRWFFFGTQVSKTQVRSENKTGTQLLKPESEMKSQFLRLETGNSYVT